MGSQIMEGNWRQLRGKVQEQWGNLTDDELDQVEGNVDQLIGLVQQKTGETRESIEHHLHRLNDECDHGSPAKRAAATAQQYATQASHAASEYAHGVGESLQHSAEYVNESVRQGYEQTGQLVRRRPVESLAVTFGAGLIAGVVVGLLVRHR